MRYVKYAVLLILGLGVLTLALANRDAVTISLLPEDAAAYLGWNRSLEAPLFVVILGGVLTGLVIGFIWEWLREYRHRAAAARARAEADRLEAEVEATRRKANGGSEEAELMELIDGRKPA